MRMNCLTHAEVSDKELIGMALQLGTNRVNQSPIKALMKFH